MTSSHLIQLDSPAFTHSWFASELWGFDSLSHPFDYRITAHTSCLKHYRTLLHAPITVTVTHHNQQHTRHGVVAHLKRLSKTVEGDHRVELHIVPPLRLLTQTCDSRVFAVITPQTIPDIVQQLLTEHGISDSRWLLSREYLPLSVSVQYDESVFHYLHRLLTQAGIYYYFTQHQGRMVMVFTDNPAPHAVSSGQLTLLNMQTHQGDRKSVV
jgi:type VI secretion system secreted protein VgrG